MALCVDSWLPQTERPFKIMSLIKPITLIIQDTKIFHTKEASFCNPSPTSSHAPTPYSPLPGLLAYWSVHKRVCGYNPFPLPGKRDCIPASDLGSVVLLARHDAANPTAGNESTSDELTMN